MSAEHRSDLDELYGRLQVRAARSREGVYRIPSVWDCWGYQQAKRAGRGEVAVDPYRFLTECLERVILPARNGQDMAGRSLSRIRGLRRLAAGKIRDGETRRRGGDWIRRSTVYGMLVRATAAWDHDGDGRLRSRRWSETGTFVKSILLLPLLRRIGIDVISLLPVSRCSRMFRKGEIGCPYATQSFFELEPDLHDRLLGADASAIGMEFGAFIEAAHALGMRVMVDLAPRTASRDSDLILEHPDWFYWIDRKFARSYGPPRLDGIAESIPRPLQLADIFGRQTMRRHLAMFRHDPSVSQPGQWREFVRLCRANGVGNLHREVMRRFGVVTAPGFSDCINDPQPPWSDVTFLRLFLDHPALSVRHLADAAGQAPYVFTDTIKSSRFPGRRPNRGLWNLLSDILPFYQRFGVDGARVDMGHALPRELQAMIVDKARRADPDFCFLSEEHDAALAGAARRDGYNAITGACWADEPRSAEGALHDLVQDVLPQARLPVLATAEVADSPRAVVFDGGRRFARMAAVLNSFLPNAIPFVNSGAEMFERQPMNLGLNPRPPGRYALPRTDPYYGKLAYFDRVALHWANRGTPAMLDLLERASEIRRRFLVDLTRLDCHFLPRISRNAELILAIGWRVEARRSTLMVIANVDFRLRRHCTIEGLPAGKRAGRACETLLEVNAGRGRPRLVSGTLRLRLEPGQATVLLL